jgi:hypothetical protein
MRESTASAPGTYSHDHYKTAAVIAKLPEDHVDYFPELAETYAALMSATQARIRSEDMVQLHRCDFREKIPGRPIIEKLRIITYPHKVRTKTPGKQSLSVC